MDITLRDLLGGHYPVVHWIGPIDEAQHEKIMGKIEKALETKPEHIVLWVSSSEGGDLNVAWNFYSFIRAAGVPLVTVTGGDVLSAATMLYVSGLTRFASPTASFFFHDPFYPHMEDVTVRNIESLVVTVRLTHERYLGVLGQELKIPKSRIDKLSRETTRLSAEEAREIGLVHEIFKTAP